MNRATARVARSRRRSSGKAVPGADQHPVSLHSSWPWNKAGGNLNTAIDANARVQADVLRSSSTVIREALGKGTIKVIAGVYDLGSGKVALS